MKFLCAFFLSLLLASIQFASAEEQESALTEQDRSAILDPENDFNCKIYGTLAVMFTERIKLGLQKAEAIKSINEELNAMENKSEKDRNAQAFISSTISTVADEIYDNDSLNFDTAKHAFPYLCLFKAIRPITIEQRNAFLQEALQCQKNYPVGNSNNPLPLAKWHEECVMAASKSHLHKIARNKPLPQHSLQRSLSN